MSKQLYDEALADVKKIREVAESDAKHAIIEAVTPRIRELIERELLSEATDDCDDADKDEEQDCEVLTDNVDEGTSECEETMDESDVSDFGDGTVTEETEDPLRVTHDVAKECSEMRAQVQVFKNASSFIRETTAFSDQVSRMIARVENMYGYVQSTKSDKQNVFEQKLEGFNQDLNEIQETAEMAKKQKQLNEENVNLQLTGLPDDIDLEQIGVDLIAGDEEVDGLPGDDLDLDAGVPGEDEDLDLDGLDLGGDEGGDELSFDDEEPVAEEGFNMSEDTEVEIDESMLRREIAKFKKLREAACAVDASALDDFGGGHSEGDPWQDGEVDDEDGEGTVTVAEGLDDVDLFADAEAGPSAGLGELDPSEFGDDSIDVDLSDLDGPAPGGNQFEAVKSKLALETRLLARSRARQVALKTAFASAKKSNNVKLESKIRAEYKTLATRINESAATVKKLQGALVKSKKSVNEARDNRASKTVAEGKVTKDLRTQLAETNLTNLKLRFANKLLQNENLSAKQKAQVIERLDEAKTEREAKLLYEGITKTVGQKTIRESSERQVLGSSSRPTRSASTTTAAPINESNGQSFDLDRWAHLAGIKGAK